MAARDAAGGAVVIGEEDEDEEEETDAQLMAKLEGDDHAMENTRLVEASAHQIRLGINLRNIKSQKHDIANTSFERANNLLRQSAQCLQRSSACVKDTNHLMRQAALNLHNMLQARK